MEEYWADRQSQGLYSEAPARSIHQQAPQNLVWYNQANMMTTEVGMSSSLEPLSSRVEYLSSQVNLPGYSSNPHQESIMSHMTYNYYNSSSNIEGPGSEMLSDAEGDITVTQDSYPTPAHLSSGVEDPFSRLIVHSSPRQRATPSSHKGSTPNPLEDITTYPSPNFSSSEACSLTCSASPPLFPASVYASPTQQPQSTRNYLQNIRRRVPSNVSDAYSYASDWSTGSLAPPFIQDEAGSPMDATGSWNQRRIFTHGPYLPSEAHWPSKPPSPGNIFSNMDPRGGLENTESNFNKVEALHSLSTMGSASGSPVLQTPHRPTLSKIPSTPSPMHIRKYFPVSSTSSSSTSALNADPSALLTFTRDEEVLSDFLFDFEVDESQWGSSKSDNESIHSVIGSESDVFEPMKHPSSDGLLASLLSEDVGMDGVLLEDHMRGAILLDNHFARNRPPSNSNRSHQASDAEDEQEILADTLESTSSKSHGIGLGIPSTLKNANRRGVSTPQSRRKSRREASSAEPYTRNQPSVSKRSRAAYKNEIPSNGSVGVHGFLDVKYGDSLTDEVLESMVEKTTLHTTTGGDVGKKGRTVYACSGCRDIFSRKDSAFDHLRAVLGDRRFSCATCQKDFVRKSDYERHLQSHSSKSFPCVQCQRLFSRSDACKKHYAKAHQMNVITRIDKVTGKGVTIDLDTDSVIHRF